VQYCAAVRAQYRTSKQRKKCGLVEVGEGYVGRKERGSGRIGRGAQSKSLVAVAVEHWNTGEPGAAGRGALAVIPDATAPSLRAFLRAKVQLESAVLTDAFTSYSGLTPRGYAHAAIPLGDDRELTRRLFPWVHVTLSNLKRFLLGTHPKPQTKHLSRYVAEFTYRLNRRWQEASLFDRLARTCLSTNIITHRELVAAPELA